MVIMADKNNQVFLIGSLISSAIAAILLFVEGLAGYMSYQAGDYYYWAVDSDIILQGAAPFFITVAGLELILLSGISIWGLYAPDKVESKHMRLAFLISLQIIILTVILAIIFAIVRTIDDDWDWWFEAGFYGNIIGGILAALFFNLSEKNIISS